jgi:hypothetical protein
VRNFIRRLPTGKGEPIDIDIEEFGLDRADEGLRVCREWHEEVQPFIRYNSARADRHWNWPMIASLMFGGAADKRPKILLMRARYPTGSAPAAIMALLEDEDWVTGAEQSSVFVWHFATTPRMALPRLVEIPEGSSPPRLLGRAALDMAVTIAVEEEAKGRLWLTTGGGAGTESLAQWCALENGMCRLPAEAIPTLPSAPRLQRTNGGRCFVHTPATAHWSHASLDAWR